jgi:threonine dehydrogenase-like Zn-dependent dehydrogenase
MYWEKLLKMIESGEIDPLKMVSHRVLLDELDVVYYKFDKKEDGMQKVFVQTKFSAPATPGSPPLTTYKK